MCFQVGSAIAIKPNTSGSESTANTIMPTTTTTLSTDAGVSEASSHAAAKINRSYGGPMMPNSGGSSAGTASRGKKRSLTGDDLHGDKRLKFLERNRCVALVKILWNGLSHSVHCDVNVFVLYWLALQCLLALVGRHCFTQGHCFLCGFWTLILKISYVRPSLSTQKSKLLPTVEVSITWYTSFKRSCGVLQYNPPFF